MTYARPAYVRLALTTVVASQGDTTLVTLVVEDADFVLDVFDDRNCLLERGFATGIVTPASDALQLGVATTAFCVDLVAYLALLSLQSGAVDELHAACFADAVLIGAVLTEVAPLPVAAGKDELVVETHVSDVDWETISLGKMTGPRAFATHIDLSGTVVLAGEAIGWDDAT